MTITEKTIRRNSIERLSELFREWLNEKSFTKDITEPITVYELAEFFDYINNALWDKW